jgi:NitT/TauT family transport system substrate-binding protein
MFFKKYSSILLAIIIIIASFIALFSGCSGKNLPVTSIEEIPTVETQVTLSAITVNIGSLKGPTSIGMIKLHEEKPSLGKNVTSNYEIVASPDIMISKLLSGEIDIAALPTNVAVKLYNKGLDYKLAAITGYGVLYILKQDVELAAWEDLKNKKINVISKGSTPDVILRYLMEKNNLKPGTDVELDYSLEQVELSQLMIAGKTNIAILPEPFVTMVLMKNDNVSIAFNIEEEWKKVVNNQPLPMSCLVVSSKLSENNHDTVDVFLNQYRQSIDWANNNPDEASLLIEKFKIGMDARTAREAIPRCNIKFTDSDAAKESVQNYIKILLEFSPEDVGGKIPDENFYY